MLRLFDQEKSVKTFSLKVTIKYIKILTCDVVPLNTCSWCVQDPVFEVSSSLRVKIADLGNACWVVSFFYTVYTANIHYLFYSAQFLRYTYYKIIIIVNHICSQWAAEFYGFHHTFYLKTKMAFGQGFHVSISLFPVYARFVPASFYPR